MEVKDLLIDRSRKDYKCYSELFRLLDENQYFMKVITSGLVEGKVRGFDEKLWDDICSQNIRRINSFEDVFVDGANIGYCTVTAKQLSYSLDDCYLCGGTLSLLEKTKNCEDGSHTWILCNNEIIDTTLMLIISYDYMEKMGYIEENRYNPNFDSIYLAAKSFTRDISMGGRKR